MDMVILHALLPLFKKFIAHSRAGKRTKKDGSRIKEQSVANYVYCEKLLLEFSLVKNFDLVVYQVKGDNVRQHARLRKYHQKFYRLFTSFLYKEKNCHDNYVGQTIKQVRTFYGWLNQEGIHTGNYYKNYYVIKNDGPILTFSVDQLKFLSFHQDFENSLSRALKRSKDMLVFGCMVGLRFGDLVSIRQSNIEFREGNYYLKMQAIKTGISTSVKLSGIAVKVLARLTAGKELQEFRAIAGKSDALIFRPISLDRFNTNIKRIGELAGWTYPVLHSKSRKGISRKRGAKPVTCRFCDAISSHIMRRTCITTMLIAGMPEFVVKKISGHTNDSKSFFRYVDLAQSIVDKEINKMHQLLENGY